MPHRTSLPIADVAIADAFWSPRRAIVRTGTIPHQERRLREGGQFEALLLKPRSHDDDDRERFPIFWESDVAKWIEAASYLLATEDAPGLEAAVDEAIALLAGAQQEDGYLNSYFTAVKPGKRFTDLRDAHELYCAGHLIEAGAAHFEATGKTSLLDVVRRYADLIDREFGPGGPREGGYCGHQEVELALVKLFRATGERRYLELSRRFIDDRGRAPFYFDAEALRRGDPGYFGGPGAALVRSDRRSREYHQSHAPVREQTEVVGHAVRAMYQYCAMADLAFELGDAGLREACERLWDDLVSSKVYVTGGIGSDPSIEGFGPAFDLPDRTGYAETCAAIGLVFWAHRMMLLTGEAKYVDVLERALYNGVLAGASEDGTRFFYGNPLASDGTVERSDWFDCACCPPNLARLLTSLEHYVYAADTEGLWVNLYVTGSVRFANGGQRVKVHQESGYPWDGAVKLTVEAQEPLAMTLRLRIPEWAAGASLAVNGTTLPYTTAQGYAVLARTWAPGDRVELTLPMDPVLVRADARVASAHGKVAVQRGPIVHCVEEVDNAAPVPDLVLARDGELRVEHEDGRDRIIAAGLVDRPAEGGLYRAGAPAAEPTEVRTVPYYAWANRGKGTMAVWIREAPSTR